MNNILSSLGISVNDVNRIIPHQANVRIIEAIATKLKFPIDKIVITLQNHANTSAASIPLALYNHYSQGKLKRGDLVMFTAAGGGFTWGSMLLKW